MSTCDPAPLPMQGPDLHHLTSQSAIPHLQPSRSMPHQPSPTALNVGEQGYRTCRAPSPECALAWCLRAWGVEYTSLGLGFGVSLPWLCTFAALQVSHINYGIAASCGSLVWWQHASTSRACLVVEELHDLRAKGGPRAYH